MKMCLNSIFFISQQREREGEGRGKRRERERERKVGSKEESDAKGEEA